MCLRMLRKLVERNLWFVQKNLYFWVAEIGREELVVCTIFLPSFPN
jgi:hypothetical protein